MEELKFQHFEDVWNAAEKNASDDDKSRLVQSLVMELTYKLGLYEAIDLNEQITADEKKKAKEQIFGSLLMTLSILSLKDNIDVFSAMGQEVLKK
jgi:hypothetical protein